MNDYYKALVASVQEALRPDRGPLADCMRLEEIRLAVSQYKIARTVSGLLQRDVAEGLGLPQGYISMWESGRGYCPRWCRPKLLAFYEALTKEISP